MSSGLYVPLGYRHDGPVLVHCPRGHVYNARDYLDYCPRCRRHYRVLYWDVATLDKGVMEEVAKNARREYMPGRRLPEEEL